MVVIYTVYQRTGVSHSSHCQFSSLTAFLCIAKGRGKGKGEKMHQELTAENKFLKTLAYGQGEHMRGGRKLRLDAEIATYRKQLEVEYMRPVIITGLQPMR